MKHHQTRKRGKKRFPMSDDGVWGPNSPRYSGMNLKLPRESVSASYFSSAARFPSFLIFFSLNPHSILLSSHSRNAVLDPSIESDLHVNCLSIQTGRDFAWMKTELQTSHAFIPDARSSSQLLDAVSQALALSPTQTVKMLFPRAAACLKGFPCRT